MAQAIDKSHFALEIARELVCRNTASYIWVCNHLFSGKRSTVYFCLVPLWVL